MGALLGGVQSLSCNAMDEVICIPTEAAAKVALMTQHILANESGIADVADPLGGSYYIESLTNQMEKQALEIVEQVAARGGAQKAIAEGFYQAACRKASSEYQREIENGERVIVGLNKFQDKDEKLTVASFKVDEGIQQRIIDQLHKLKAERDNDRVAAALRNLDCDVRAGKNSVPALVECVKAYATIGEMCQVLGEIWGYYKEGASWT